MIIETEPFREGEAEDLTGWKAIDSLRWIVKDAPWDMAENHDRYL